MVEPVIAVGVGHDEERRAVALGHLGDRLDACLAVEVKELVESDLRVGVGVHGGEHLVRPELEAILERCERLGVRADVQRRRDAGFVRFQVGRREMAVAVLVEAAERSGQLRRP